MYEWFLESIALLKELNRFFYKFIFKTLLVFRAPSPTKINRETPSYFNGSEASQIPILFIDIKVYLYQRT